MLGTLLPLLSSKWSAAVLFVAITCFSAGSTAQGTTGVWERVFRPGTTESWMAPLGDKLVLFTGDAETWEWDGSVWTQRFPANSPPPRRDSAVVAYRGKVLLFGGYNLSDMWEWDGTNWSEVQQPYEPNPGRTHKHAMAVAQDKVLMAGAGRSATWLWDGATWTQPSTTPRPSGRFDPAMVSLGDSVLLFDGDDKADTWLWDGAAWTELTPAHSPPRRERHAMVAVDGGAILFGGNQVVSGDNVSLGDMWFWDGTDWTPIVDNPPPPPRADHTMARLGDDIVLVGGEGMSFEIETWVWDGETWADVIPMEVPRVGSGYAWAPLSDRLVFYGGIEYERPNNRSAETWEWDGMTWTRKFPTDSPGVRAGHAMATLGNAVVLFGGEGISHDETWEWDGTNWAQQYPAHSPPPTHRHQMVSYDGNVLMFGGDVVAGALQDATWVWAGSDWQELTPASAPSPRRGHGMTVFQDHVLVFGGSTEADTFQWDGTNWIALSPSSSPPPMSPAMATVGDRVVAYEGGLTPSTWEWDGVTWTENVTRVTPDLVGVAMGVLDETGYIFGPHGEMWAYRRVLNIGSECAEPSECATGYCVDGFCCTQSCEGQCEACDHPGTEGVCGAVVGESPHGTRTGCDGEGACAALCGSSGTCEFPRQETTCEEATCVGDEVVAPGYCDGYGVCVQPAAVSCAPLVCIAGACVDAADPAADVSEGLEDGSSPPGDALIADSVSNEDSVPVDTQTQDAGQAEPATGGGSDSGCGCGIAHAPLRGVWTLSALFFAVVLALRRRRRS